VEVDATVTRVGVAGNRETWIQLLERNAHSVDYARGSMTQVTHINRRNREAHRRTILSMLETTPATVARPHGPAQPGEPIPDLDFDWRPHPLERGFTSRRTYRWPIVVGAVLAGVGVIAAARYLVQVPVHSASVRQADFLAAANDFADALHTLDTAPTATDPDVATGFATAAAALRETAEAPLPWAFPLLPLGPDLAPVRAKLLEVSDTASALSDELTEAARYRAAADSILAVPLLPFEAPAELIDPAAKALADMQATSESAVSALDEDPTYESYRIAVGEVMADLPGWIDRYLLALRRGETPAATNLIAQLQARVGSARGALDAVFTTVDADADAAVATLRAGVEAVQVLAG
jgi:hypothetical protein